MQQMNSMDSHTKWLSSSSFRGAANGLHASRNARFSPRKSTFNRIGNSGEFSVSAGDDIYTFHFEEERNSFGHSLRSESPRSKADSPREFDFSISPTPPLSGRRGENSSSPLASYTPSSPPLPIPPLPPPSPLPNTTVPPWSLSSHDMVQNDASPRFLSSTAGREGTDSVRQQRSSQNNSLNGIGALPRKPPYPHPTTPLQSPPTSPILKTSKKDPTAVKNSFSTSLQSVKVSQTGSECQHFSQTLAPPTKRRAATGVSKDFERQSKDGVAGVVTPAWQPHPTNAAAPLEDVSSYDDEEVEQEGPRSGFLVVPPQPIPFSSAPQPTPRVAVETALSLLDSVPDSERSAQLSSRALQALSCMQGFALQEPSSSSAPAAERRRSARGEGGVQKKKMDEKVQEHERERENRGGEGHPSPPKEHGKVRGGEQQQQNKKNPAGGNPRNLYEEAKRWKWQKARWAAIEREKKENVKEEEETLQCTFQPKLSPYAEHLQRPPSLRPENRAQYELLQRRVWLAIKKKEEVEKELKHCTFHPLTLEAIKSARYSTAHRLAITNTREEENERKRPRLRSAPQVPGKEGETVLLSSEDGTVFEKLFEDAKQREHFQSRTMQRAARQVKEVIAEGESGGVSHAPEMSKGEIQQVVERLFSRCSVPAIEKWLPLAPSHTPELSKKTKALIRQKVERGERPAQVTAHLYPYHRTTPDKMHTARPTSPPPAPLAITEKATSMPQDDGDGEEEEVLEAHPSPKEENENEDDTRAKGVVSAPLRTHGPSLHTPPLEIARKNLQRELRAQEKEEASARKRQQERWTRRLYTERMKSILQEKYQCLAKQCRKEEEWGMVVGQRGEEVPLPISSIAKAAAVVLLPTEGALLLKTLAQLGLTTLTERQFVRVVLQDILHHAQAQAVVPSMARHKKVEDDDEKDEEEEEEEEEKKKKNGVTAEEAEECMPTRPSAAAISSSLLLRLSSSHPLLQPLPAPTTTASIMGTTAFSAASAAGQPMTPPLPLPRVRRESVDPTIVEAARLKREIFLRESVLAAERKKLGYLPGEDPPAPFHARPIPAACRSRGASGVPLAAMKTNRATFLRDRYVEQQQRQARGVDAICPVMAPAIPESVARALFTDDHQGEAEDGLEEEEEHLEVLVDEDGKECILGGEPRTVRPVGSSVDTARANASKNVLPTTIAAIGRKGGREGSRPYAMGWVKGRESYTHNKKTHTPSVAPPTRQRLSYTTPVEARPSSLGQTKADAKIRRVQRCLFPSYPPGVDPSVGYATPTVLLSKEKNSTPHAGRMRSQEGKRQWSAPGLSARGHRRAVQEATTHEEAHSTHPALRLSPDHGEESAGWESYRHEWSSEGRGGRKENLPACDDDDEEEGRSPLPRAVEGAHLFVGGDGEGGGGGGGGRLALEEIALPHRSSPDGFFDYHPSSSREAVAEVGHGWDGQSSSPPFPYTRSEDRWEDAFAPPKAVRGHPSQDEAGDSPHVLDPHSRSPAVVAGGGRGRDEPHFLHGFRSVEGTGMVVSHSISPSQEGSHTETIRDESLMDIPYALRPNVSPVSRVYPTDPLQRSSPVPSALGLMSGTMWSVGKDGKQKMSSTSFTSSSSRAAASGSSKHHRSDAMRTGNSGRSSSRVPLDMDAHPSKQATALLKQVIAPSDAETQEIFQFGKDLLIQQLRQYQRRRN